jgi:Phage Mu protein F like protein
MTGANPLAASDYQDPDDTARKAAEAAAAALAALIAAGWRTITDNMDVAAIAALLSAGGWLAVRGLVTRDKLTEAMRPVTTALVNLQDNVAAAAMADEVAAAAQTVPSALFPPPAPMGLLTYQPAALTPEATPVATPAPLYPGQEPLHPTTGVVTPRPLPVPEGMPTSGVMRPPAAALTPMEGQGVIPLGFDPIDPALVTGQQRAAATFIDRVAATIEAVIDQDIRHGLTNGMGADEIAQVIKQTIGLTPRQAAAVQNFRRLLENGDAAALDRVLRDRRFDASVQRAIDGGTLDPAQIDRMVERYAERYVAHRAKVIANTETLRAANAGRRAAWEQFADRRGLDDSDVLRFWQTATDERVCPVCSAIPGMNPDGVPLDGMYATPIGPLMMPPDPHPSCRCGERFALAPRVTRLG